MVDVPRSDSSSVAGAVLPSRRARLGALRRLAGTLVLPAVMVAAGAFLLFYNLPVNPRPWHDEGAALTVAKTLVEDGYYGVRTSEGYQTFGPVQSVGPTVLLPIALTFRLFGVGLLAGRVVAAAFALGTLVLFYLAARRLFGRRAAWLGTVLMVSSPTVNFIHWGRQALGEIPAFGFLLAGWLVWSGGACGKPRVRHLLAGLLWGAAIVTKSHYLITILGTAALLALLDLLHYRTGAWRGLLVAAVAALACVAAWWGWQMLYFGMPTFRENAAKLAELGARTSGFSPTTSLDALRSIVGASGPLYYFWFLPGFVYACLIAVGKQDGDLSLHFLIIFVILVLSYYLLISNPWSHYALPAFAILGILVGKMLGDLLQALVLAAPTLRRHVAEALRLRQHLALEDTLTLGTLVAVATMTLLMAGQFQSLVRIDVLDRAGLGSAPRRIPQLQAPYQAASLLSALAQGGAVVDTWERELGILTTVTFHYPDQSLLAPAHAAIYRGGPHDYALGEDYFREHRPTFVVVGWFARWLGAYDMDYLRQNARLVGSVGEGEWRYDIYRWSAPIAEGRYPADGAS